MFAEFLDEEISENIAEQATEESEDENNDENEEANETEEEPSDDFDLKNVGNGIINQELKAFPGAEGFGKYATGGRGGRVIEVTNLNDSGSGSLRAAIEESGSRVVIFKVSGYIILESELKISKGDITIAGQTAPGDGITLRGSENSDMAGIAINTNNVIVRGLRIRLGPGRDHGKNGDALQMTWGGRNIIFDHCSFSWGTDEIINPWGASQITFQNCIFSEALMYSSHEYSTDSSSDRYYRPHSMGMIVGSGSTDISICNSIFAHNNQRNPLIGGNSDSGKKFELVNNVYYNWGEFGTVLSSDVGLEINLINNVHIEGPDTNSSRYPIQISSSARIYAKGNINKFRASNSEPEWNAIGNAAAPYNQQANQSSQVSSPFNYPLSDAQTMSPGALVSLLTENAGSFTHDAVDKRVMNDIISGSGQLINDPSEVGGYPKLVSGTAYSDRDKDGIADEWEISTGLDPDFAEDANADRNSDGYSNLEEFLHYLTID